MQSSVLRATPIIYPYRSRSKILHQVASKPSRVVARCTMKLRNGPSLLSRHTQPFGFWGLYAGVRSCKGSDLRPHVQELGCPVTCGKHHLLS